MAMPLKLQLVFNAVSHATAPIKKLEASTGELRKKIQAANQSLAAMNSIKDNLPKLIQDRQAAAAKMVEIRKRVATAEKALAVSPGSKTAAREYERASAVLAKHQLVLDRLRAKRNALLPDLQKEGIHTRSLTAAQAALTNRIAQTTQALDHERAALKLNERAMARFKAIQANLASFRGKARMAGMHIGGLGMGALYGAKRFLEPVVAYEKSMAEISAKTGLTQQSEAFKVLETGIRAVAETGGYAAGEVTQAASAMTAAFNPEEINQALPAIMNLARAGGVEAQRAAEISSNLRSAWRLSASEMTGLSDLLVQASRVSNISLDQLHDSLKDIAPVAQRYGLSMASATAMSGLLGDAGIHGTQASKALKTILDKLSSPALLKKHGIKARDAAGNLLPLNEIFKKIEQKLKGKGNAIRGALYKEIFGNAGMSGELIARMSESGLSEYLETLENSAGAAQRASNAMNDNLSGDIVGLKNAWENLSVQIGSDQGGPLRELVQWVTELVRGFGQWIKENPKLAGTLTKVVGVGVLLAPLVGLLLMIAAALTLIITPVGLVIAKFLLFATIIGASIYAVYKLVSTIWDDLCNDVWGTLQVIGSMILDWSPIGLFYQAFRPVLAWFASLFGFELPERFSDCVSGIAALILNWSPIDLFHQVFRPVQAWFASLCGFELPAKFSDCVSSIAALIVNWSPIGLFYQAFASVLSWFGIDLPAKFSDFGRMIVDGLTGGIGSRLENLKNKAGELADSLKAKVKGVLGIESPSRVFMEIGGFAMQGLAEGLASSSVQPLAKVGEIVKKIAAAGAVSLGLTAPAAALASVPPMPEPIAAPVPPISLQTPGGKAADPFQKGSAPGSPINITIHAAPGMDEKKLAELVAQKIRENQLASQARTRSRLVDAD